MPNVSRVLMKIYKALKSAHVSKELITDDVEEAAEYAEIICGEEVRWLSHLEVFKKLYDYKDDITHLVEVKGKDLIGVTDQELVHFLTEMNQVIVTL